MVGRKNTFPVVPSIFPLASGTIQAIELNNGRAAQMGILGLMMHEAVNNHPYIINDLVSSAKKDLLASCFASLSYSYGELLYALHHRRAMIDYLV